ncbi:unnamed protein product [marine sediment metagenome]|uniref:Uncharacterized protein n=1 Tax=marine sediment metagenome TaxID=412755 RepID=X1PZE9_9ZZZZ
MPETPDLPKMVIPILCLEKFSKNGKSAENAKPDPGGAAGPARVKTDV